MKIILGALCLALGLAGCSYGIDKRYGLDPVLNPTQVENSSQDKNRILTALAADGGVVNGSPYYWYAVTEAGFNYIDDQCGAYFQQLFFLNRDRERIKGGLGAASAATAAILGVTGASTSTMAIVAQAFGLGIAGTDLGSAAYLYQLPPSTTEGFVRQMQLAYRQGAAERRNLIVSAPAAYHAIQEYLSLCLPPTIEAKLAEHIASARATPDPVTVTSSTSFGVNLSTPLPAALTPRQQVRNAVGTRVAAGPIVAPSAPVLPSPRPVRPANSDENDIELSIPPSEWHGFKQALCVAGPEASTDDIGPETRDHLQEFMAGYSSRLAATAPRSVNARTRTALRGAARKFPSCDGPVRNAYELGVYSRFPAAQVDGILQGALAKNKAAVDPYSVRPAIRRLREVYGLPQSDELDDQFWVKALQDGVAGLPGGSDTPPGPRG